MTPWGFRVTVSITNLEFCSPSPQAIINSTVTPNMTFTKTSQKFGQWADSRANTVYGLGFASEQHLTQVGFQDYMVGGQGWAWVFSQVPWGPWAGDAEWASELDHPSWVPGSCLSSAGHLLPFGTYPALLWVPGTGWEFPHTP